MDTTERPRRVNGLQRPFTTAQLSTWAFLPLLVIQFLLFVSPVLPLIASIICTCIFCCLAGASTFYAYTAMKIDPSDPRLLVSSHQQHQGQQQCTTHPTFDVNAPTKQCWICDVQVGEKSMHCKFCNKCVDHFDHHCMWLNTCVGKANYPYFFRCMVCITVLLVVHTTVQLGVILDIYLGNGNTKQRSEEWFGINSSTATIIVVAVMGVFLFFDLGALSLIGQLLAFHMKLRRQGLSTYAYIVQDNRRRRELADKEQKLKDRRKIEMAKAQQDGNWWLATKISNGGFLRESCGLAFCDPLSLDPDDDGGDHGAANTDHEEQTNGHNGMNGYHEEEDEESNDDKIPNESSPER